MSHPGGGGKAPEKKNRKEPWVNHPLEWNRPHDMESNHHSPFSSKPGNGGSSPGKHPLDRRQDPEERGFKHLSPEWETRTAISAILEITLSNESFKKQLEKILEVIVSVSWLKAAEKGAIFVANARNELVLVVHHSLSPALVYLCGKVPFGHCLCGKAAQRKKLIFKTCVDDDHDTRFDGMKPHGHYNVPLLDGNRVIGVMVLYLEHEHEPHPEEKFFMSLLGKTVSSFIINRTLVAKSQISNLRLKQAQQEIVQKLLTVSEYRDDETGAHIQRMSKYALILGRAIGLDHDQLQLLELATPMHDIGKIGIEDRILLKPGRLDEEEFEEMKEHTNIGGSILQGNHPLLVASREIALTHHEHWDGTGYPRGLKGTEIPLFGRICSIVDVFDALTSERPYKKSWPVEDAIQYIAEKAGSQFDPNLVEAFMANLGQFLEVRSFYNHVTNENGGSLGTPLPEQKVDKEYLNWQDQFSIGVPFVDQQHRFLVNLINRIHAGIESSDAETLAEALLDMKTYAHIHFQEEETFMEQEGYPEIQTHRKQHEAFLQTTETFLNELEEHPLAIGPEAGIYLRSWLIEHIQVQDRAYATYIQEKKKEASSSKS